MSNLYKESGVDISKSNALTEKIKEKTSLQNIGRFSAITEHPLLKDYFLVTTVDGIGTKILPLLENQDYKTIANDVIAMNLNDLACSGAFAISFSDYIALNSTEPEVVSSIVEEISKQLEAFDCRLASGETSEMKDLIPHKKMDIAGFAVGLVKKENVLPRQDIKKGDVIIGLESNGVHANGFSLIRKLYKEKKLTDGDMQAALAPTQIYLNEIVRLVEKQLIKSAANITGGGIFHNLSRALPNNLTFNVFVENIPKQPVFERLYEICSNEAYEIFNMGVGFCVILDEKDKNEVAEILKKYNPFELGVITDK